MDEPEMGVGGFHQYSTISKAKGLVERTSYESVPPCVEYSLTPLAQNFLREISYIVEWGQLHFEEIQRNRQQRKLQL